MTMASESNSLHDEAATSLEEVTRGLQRELSLRPNAAGMSGPPTPASSGGVSLIDTLRSVLSCPRNANPDGGRVALVGRGLLPGFRGVGRGLSPPRSASSDSSGGHVSNIERGNLARTRSNPSMPNAGTARPPIGRGKHTHAQSRVIGEATDCAPTSPMSTTTGVGRGNLHISGAISRACKKKRIRPSTKPVTMIVHATPETFRTMVQQLTGCKEAKLLRPEPALPQPGLLQAGAAPIVADVVTDQPARPGSSSASRMSAAALGPSPAVSNRVPEPAFRDSATSSSTSYMNYCMGYEGFPFPQQQELLPEESGIPDDDLQPVSDSALYGNADRPGTQYSSHETCANAASPAGSSFQVAHSAAPLVSEGDDERDSSLRAPAASLGFATGDDFMMQYPSDIVAPRNRPSEVFREWPYETLMEADWECWSCDSWINGPQ